MSAEAMQGMFTVLGCRAGSPGQGSAASGYLVRAGAQTILVDCGPGVVLELTRRNLLATIDAVIITHRHADHCADLVALAYHRLFPTRAAPLPLYAPADALHVINSLDTLFGIESLADLARPLTVSFALHPLEPGEALEIAGLRVDTLRAQHPVTTLALRFPQLGLVYSSDGALTPELLRFATGARVLLAEATYLSAEGHDLDGHGHMTARQAGTLARDASVGQLVLTHLADYGVAAASVQRAQSVFCGPVMVAEPGLQVALTHA